MERDIRCSYGQVHLEIYILELKRRQKQYIVFGLFLKLILFILVRDLFYTNGKKGTFEHEALMYSVNDIVSRKM